MLRFATNISLQVLFSFNSGW